MPKTLLSNAAQPVRVFTEVGPIAWEGAQLLSVTVRPNDHSPFKKNKQWALALRHHVTVVLPFRGAYALKDVHVTSEDFVALSLVEDLVDCQFQF